MKLLLVIPALLFSQIALAERFEIPFTSKFTSDARIVKGQFGSKQMGSINGVKYRRYEDASGAFEGEPNAFAGNDILSKKATWSVGCSIDDMSDKQTCNVSESSTTLFISLEKGKGVNYVSLFSHDFPGKEMTIRIGSGSPVSSRRSFTGGQAKNLVKQMAKGTVVKTRYYSWPYSVAKGGKVTIYGLTEALRYAEWVLSGNHTPLAVSAPPKPAKPAQPIKKAAPQGVLYHMHGDRGHSHAFPAQGKAHQHGGGPIGR